MKKVWFLMLTACLLIPSLYAIAAGGISNGNVVGAVSGYIDANGNFQPLAPSSGTVAATAIFSGQQTATANGAALPNQALVNSIIIIALSSNTGIIYVGPAGVTPSNGYPLAPGQAIGFSVTNANAIYIVGASAGVGSIAWTGN